MEDNWSGINPRTRVRQLAFIGKLDPDLIEYI